jgi:transposase
MSLHPHPVPPVPESTRRIAQAAFRRGNPYMKMRAEFGALFTDEAFAPLFAVRGQPAEGPWRLALVTIMQYAEGLPDRQAADAVRGRIDWKYALSLSLDDPGFDASVLCEFRARLVSGGLEQQMLDLLLEHFQARKLLKAGGRQRTDSTHVVAAIRILNRLELVGETLRAALNALAIAAPDWLHRHADPAWVDRYGPRVTDLHLPSKPAERRALAAEMGVDGYRLLAAVYALDAPTWLRTVPAVETLRRVWVQQFYRDGAGVRQRDDKDGTPPSSTRIASPYDPDARYATKRTEAWTGYKVHLSETCNEGLPRLITQVETTAAPEADSAVTPTIHMRLNDKGLLPALHIVDTGYLDAELLVTSREGYGVELLGPTRRPQRFKERIAAGFGVDAFVVDWAQRHARCPGGHTSVQWDERVDHRGNASIYIRFAKADCGPCPARTQCTTAARRSIAIRPRVQYEALRERRVQEETKAFAAEYARRAGIEGTMSQGVRAFSLRRAKYLGPAKVHLQHVLTAAAMNFVRVAAWLDEVPLGKTGRSPFAKLMAPSPSVAA